MDLKKTKSFIINLSKSKFAIQFLCFIAFIEAIFFPIPPDVLLIPLAIINYKKIFFLAFLTTFFSVLGGYFGYLIGYIFFDQIGETLLNWLNAKDHFSSFSKSYNENGIFAVLLGGFSPIPYKLIAIISGTTNMSVFNFLWASIISRGLRFFLLGFLVYVLRNTTINIIKKYFMIILTMLSIVFILIIIGFK